MASDDIVEKAVMGAEALDEIADILDDMDASLDPEDGGGRLAEEHPDAYLALMQFKEPFNRLSDSDGGNDSFRVDEELR